ncbi:hypothetical protein [Nocardia arthritidis]|uniref:Uncharacterized protein n=1 Tax=Nocardia arthritidis TaxID=228602 RepID=A0A6G9YI84_9NOCA|nr:hypothetical protein [Nocardia arthritidis]QIS12908.1 hypothetical protein F5544_25270 [Nocardia arthritidis]
MNTETASATTRTITIGRVFRELDSYLAESDPAFRYDVAAGFARLRRGMGGVTDPVLRAVIGEYRGCLTITELRITSPRSSLFAARLADDAGGERWALSWLPGRAFTREQAICAMIVDEILVVHELDSTTTLRVIAELAGTIGIPVQQVLARLANAKLAEVQPRWAHPEFA